MDTQNVITIIGIVVPVLLALMRVYARLSVLNQAVEDLKKEVNGMCKARMEQVPQCAVHKEKLDNHSKRIEQLERAAWSKG